MSIAKCQYCISEDCPYNTLADCDYCYYQSTTNQEYKQCKQQQINNNKQKSFYMLPKLHTWKPFIQNESNLPSKSNPIIDIDSSTVSTNKYIENPHIEGFSISKQYYIFAIFLIFVTFILIHSRIHPFLF